MRYFLLTAACLLSPTLACLPTQAQMITVTPEQIGQIFCIGSLGNDMAPVEALLTPDLSKTIARASAGSREYEVAHPGEKPPLGDGLPWRTWPDYADGCAVGEVRIDSPAASVDIRYSFTASPDANYDNTLQLLAVEIEQGMPDFWRIDDVDLGQGQTMRSVLAVISEEE